MPTETPEMIAGGQPPGVLPTSTWHDVSESLPPVVDERRGETDYVLCCERGGTPPFVAWFNVTRKQWELAHRATSFDPVPVDYWMVLPPLPQGTLPSPIFGLPAGVQEAANLLGVRHVGQWDLPGKPRAVEFNDPLTGNLTISLPDLTAARRRVEIEAMRLKFARAAKPVSVRRNAKEAA